MTNVLTSRAFKAADICSALSKRYEDREVIARPFPTAEVTSAWLFYPPDDDEHGFSIRLTDLDNKDTDTLTERLEIAFGSVGVYRSQDTER